MRFYEETNNGHEDELAEELFLSDEIMHDPQVRRTRGRVVDVVRPHDDAANGHRPLRRSSPPERRAARTVSPRDRA